MTSISGEMVWRLCVCVYINEDVGFSCSFGGAVSVLWEIQGGLCNTFPYFVVVLCSFVTYPRSDCNGMCEHLRFTSQAIGLDAQQLPLHAHAFICRHIVVEFI